MDLVYTQDNPFIGAKRKRVPAVIRQTGCIIDRGIEFSSRPCLFYVLPPSSSSSTSLTRSPSYLHPLVPLTASVAFSLTILSRLYSISLLTLIPSCSLLSPSHVPLSQLDMNATRLLLMHRSICILQTGCIKSRPSVRYSTVKRVIYYSIWWRRVLGRQSTANPGIRRRRTKTGTAFPERSRSDTSVRATSKWTS